MIFNPIPTPIPVKLGGTGADLSATGGASQVLKQSTAGAAITVAQLAASDLSDGVSGSGAVTLVTSPALLVSPTAPTQSVGDNSTKIATTNYVDRLTGPLNVTSWRRKTIISADGSTAVFTVNGDVATIVGSTVISAGNSTLEPAIAVLNSTGNVGSLSGNPNYRVGKNIAFTVDIYPSRITDERFWIGLTDQTAATMGASDNPAGNYAAFRFSTIAGDTKIQCITKDNSTQAIADSTIALSTSVGTQLAIVFTDSIPNVAFYINGVLKATATTHLPASGTQLRYVLTSLAAVAGTGSGIYIAQEYIETDTY